MTVAGVSRLVIPVGGGRRLVAGLAGGRSRGVAGRGGASAVPWASLARRRPRVPRRVLLNRLRLVAGRLRVAWLLAVGSRIPVCLGDRRPIRAALLSREGHRGRTGRLPSADTVVGWNRRRERGASAGTRRVPRRRRGLARVRGVLPLLRRGRRRLSREALLTASLRGHGVLLVRLLPVAVLLVLPGRPSSVLLPRHGVAPVTEGARGKLQARRNLLGPAVRRVALVVIAGLLVPLLVIALAGVGLLVGLPVARGSGLRSRLVVLGVVRLRRWWLTVRRLVGIGDGPWRGVVTVRFLRRGGAALISESVLCCDGLADARLRGARLPGSAISLGGRLAVAEGLLARGLLVAVGGRGPVE